MTSKQEAAREQRLEVAGALDAADVEAQKALATGAPITSEDVERALRAMKGVWPTQCRPNVAPDSSGGGFVPGMCLGLVPDRSYAGCSIAKVSKQHPALTRLITAWVKTTLGKEDKTFKYGACQVNYNYVAKKHIDMNNLGPSYISSLGKHTGGELWTGDRGILNCRSGKWKLFDGNTLHCTQPFKGERFSFILFTPDAYNRLLPSYRDEALALGFTAASSNGKDDPYFQQFRDLGRVEERDFDKLMSKRSEEAPPPVGSGTVTVECNGYAAGRGSGWVSFQGASRKGCKGSGASEGHHCHEILAGSGVEVVHFAKNKVGIHVVELEMLPTPSSSSSSKSSETQFRLISSQTFNLYGDTIAETRRWVDWVAKRPEGRIVAICITDTAMAKTRPLGQDVYHALYELGAPASLTLIGYREPFAFVGWKGLRRGGAVVQQDAKKQSKTLVRIETIIERFDGPRSAKKDAGMRFFKSDTSELKLLGALSVARKQARKRTIAVVARSVDKEEQESGKRKGKGDNKGNQRQKKRKKSS